MADEVEKILTIPLRISKSVPRNMRAKRAIKEVKEFVARHMNASEGLTEEEFERFASPLEKIWVDTKVNEAIWDRGIQKPPSVIRVRAIKFEDGLIEVSLPEE
ncbi:MAG TPA: 50S ribosomal protein L31e [Euryarchaeota archaeon]|nr:50S ribosomal protein L31e [Euryarchaeota archaeon]